MVRLLIAFLAAGVLSTIDGTPADARRGGGSFMDSAGYQRALHESRRARSQQKQEQLERELNRKKPRAR
jgi:hypothetical protein